MVSRPGALFPTKIRRDFWFKSRKMANRSTSSPPDLANEAAVHYTQSPFCRDEHKEPVPDVFKKNRPDVFVATNTKRTVPAVFPPKAQYTPAGKNLLHLQACCVILY